jgi:ribonucleoside-triphosphate reductase
MSNNSVVCNDIRHLPQAFWDTYGGNSEPYGLINLKLSQSCGRLGETQYPDKKASSYNPCAEQTLEKYETCCLAEVFLPNIASAAELRDVVTLLYRINKHSLRLPCHNKETEEVVHRNMRMGVGVTGYLQATEEQKGWLSNAYVELRKYDKEYSKAHGWPVSIKLTTCKPSGTLSLLPGVTPGVHPGYARYMIRRIRIAAEHPLVQVCRDHGYPVEFQRNFDKTPDYSTQVVEFPFSYPEGTVMASSLTALDQLEFVRRLQTEWSDNSVSCTVYYKLEELPTIQAFLKKNYNKGFKTLSFLLHSGHGFDQAPYEEITKEDFENRLLSSQLITSISSAEFESADECASGVCPIK